MLESIKENLYKFSYQDVINQNNQISGIEKIQAQPYVILTYLHLANYDLAASLIEDATKLVNKTKNPMIYDFQLKVCKVVELFRTARYEQLKPLLIHVRELYDHFDASISAQIPDFFILMRNYEVHIATDTPLMDSIEILEDNLRIAQESGFELLSSMSIYNLCVRFVAIGELEQAKSLAIGHVESFNPASKPGLPSYYYFRLLGWIELNLGHQESSINYFNKSLLTSQSLSDSILRTAAYSHLIIALCEFDLRDEGEKYLTELNNYILAETDNSILYTSLRDLAKSIYLKSSKRIHAFAEAQIILESLIELTLTNNFAHFDPLLQNLVLTVSLDLLIEEYQLLNNEEILDEIIALVNNLEELAEFNQSINLKIHALLFNSKLYLLKDEFEKSNQTLVKALDLAEFHKLGKLTNHIITEIELLEKNITKWASIHREGSKIASEFDLKNFREYLYDITKVITDYTPED